MNVTYICFNVKLLKRMLHGYELYCYKPHL